MPKSKYPELDEIALDLADHVSISIARVVKQIKSKMPYKNQYVLEKLIEELKERV